MMMMMIMMMMMNCVATVFSRGQEERELKEDLLY